MYKHMYVLCALLIQIEGEYFIQLHVNENGTLGYKNALTLVVLRSDDLILANNHLPGEF